MIKGLPIYTLQLSFDNKNCKNNNNFHQKNPIIIEGYDVKIDFTFHNKHIWKNISLVTEFHPLQASLSFWPVSPDSWDLWSWVFQAFKMWSRGCWTDPWQMPLTPTGRHQQHNHLTLSSKCWVSVGKMKVRPCVTGRGIQSGHSRTLKTAPGYLIWNSVYR